MCNVKLGLFALCMLSILIVETEKHFTMCIACSVMNKVCVNIVKWVRPCVPSEAYQQVKYKIVTKILLSLSKIAY